MTALTQHAYGSTYPLEAQRYDALGRLVARAVGSPGTRYLWAGGRIVEEHDDSPGYGLELRHDYVWGGGKGNDLVLRDTADPEYPEYFFLDAQGNVRTRFGLVGYQEAVQARYVYAAYGTPHELSADWVTWQAVGEDGFLAKAWYWRFNVAQYAGNADIDDPGLGILVQPHAERRKGPIFDRVQDFLSQRHGARNIHREDDLRQQGFVGA